MPHNFRCLISATAIMGLLAQSAVPALAGAVASRSAYESCQAADETGLRNAIIAVSAESLRRGTRTVDYKALVADEWRKNNLDRIIDSRVDIAVEEVKLETTWSERLQSLTNNEVSQKLATNVAERVYRSDTVKVAIEDMAAGVAREVGKSIEIASSDAATPLLNCLKAFIGPRYGMAIADAMAGDASQGLTVDANQGAGGVSAGAVIKESSGGIAGATILVVRRQLANLAARIGQRIVGSVLSRLVSVVAGGVGLVLIAKDIWEFRNGVLPIIATEMKSETTKSKVRDEIAVTIADQMNTHVNEIAAASADHVLDVWQSFKRAHALVLRIAEQNPNFRTFLDGVKPAALPRLDEVVALLVAEEGEPAVLKRLQDGSLNTAVHVMPEDAMTIARETKSVAAALDWTALAGSRLDDVVKNEIYRHAKASGFSKASLDRVLDLGDRTSIIRLASLSPKARDTLLSLDNAKLVPLVKSLNEDELAMLAGYLQDLQPAPRETVLAAVAENPGRMQVLASSGVRNAIIASADQGAAAAIMLRPGTAVSPRDFAADAVMAWEGRINPRLIWYRHPAATVVSGFILLIVFFWLARLFRPRRRDAAPPATS